MFLVNFILSNRNTLEKVLMLQLKKNVPTNYTVKRNSIRNGSSLTYISSLMERRKKLKVYLL